MVRHASRRSSLVAAFPDTRGVERNALSLALKWAIAHGQTPKQLDTALKAYLNLPKAADVTEFLRAEANVIEKTLDLPRSTLRDWLLMSTPNQAPTDRAMGAALFDGLTTPWERARVRRVNRLPSQAAIDDAIYEPWQRPGFTNSEVTDAVIITPQAAMMMLAPTRWYSDSNDRNEVTRRALVQVLAIRAWQYRHQGQFPTSLDALMPTELPTLPVDPYSGRPFGYILAVGQEVSPLRSTVNGAQVKSQAPAPGSWLLYSVGPNGRDDRGISFDQRGSLLDIVFAIPPLETTSSPHGEKAQGGMKD
jgi:hypothetical protein